MEFIGVFLLFLPFLFLLWLANVADLRRAMTPPRNTAGALVYALLVGLWLIILGAGVTVVLLGVAYQRYADIPTMMELYQKQGVDPETMVALMHSLPRLGVGFILISLAGLSVLLPPVRRLLARVLAISPDSVVHTVALSYSVLIFINLWLVLGMGVDTLLGMMEAEPAAPESAASSQMIGLVWGQDIALALMAFVGVGWLSRRSWRSALQRLGLVWPSWNDIAAGVGLGIGMFLLLIPIGLLMEQLGLGLDTGIEQLTKEMLGPLLTSLPGVITLGLAAALGEELVFRGALQPRFGVFLTALLFAFTHSQYVISVATLVVFLLGLVLGWVRIRRNTSTAMILHATYNIAIGLVGLLAAQMMK